MSYPSLLTKDSLEVILCFTLSSVTLTVQSPNSNAANWGWPKGRPSVTTLPPRTRRPPQPPRASGGASAWEKANGRFLRQVVSTCVYFHTLHPGDNSKLSE